VNNVRCPLFTRGSGCAGWFYKSNTAAHFQEYSPPFPQLWEVGVLYSAQYTLTRVAHPFLRDVCVLKCFYLTPFSAVHSVTHPSLHPWGKGVYWNVFYFNSIFDSTRSLCYPPFPSERGCNEMLFTLAPFSTVHVDSVTHSSLGEGGVLKWCFL